MKHRLTRYIVAIGMVVAVMVCQGLAVVAEAQMASPFGKVENPISVTPKIKVENGTTAVMTFSFSMSNGWHVYAQDVTGGPTPTTITIETASECKLEGELTSSAEATKKYDNAFMTELKYYEEDVVFSQRVHLEGGDYVIAGYLEYGACNDMSCLPPTKVEFNYSGTAPKREEAKPEEKAEVKAEAEKETAGETEDREEESVAAEGRDTVAIAAETETTGAVVAEVTEAEKKEGKSWAWIFVASFVAGLFALLTPCVWPIIPMTVSFFMKRTKDSGKGLRDSMTYGLSIVVIYMLLGLVVTAIFGPSALNEMSTSALANLFFTALLIVFGLSFIGAFDLSLPSSWTNAVDQKASSTTGVLSIFLMAFTLALVSFSCTGPIVGFLLVEVATQGSIMGPAIGMLGFSLALALPFTIFAMFPSMLKKLPRSGSWMMTVKVVLGFVELAFALKFFSVADLAYGWHLLGREVFISIWAALAIVLGLYLLGIVKISHGEESGEAETAVGATRVVTGVISIAFAIYMIPGLWGAPLNAISAFCPPMETQDFVIGQNVAAKQAGAKHYRDLDEAMDEARKSGKPVLVDFTGWGCVNCREMEQKVLNNQEVAEKIDEEYVFVSLYVDDKTSLGEKKTMDDGSVLRTVGDKWSYLQRSRFGVNAQPYYVKLNERGEQIGGAYTFDVNIEHFMNFLSEKQ
ncbi:MAG: thioredoxin family protein [Bacteroidales bacterium]|nr:thioredoxin family protein [Bacteroidales bacterium]